MSGSPKLCSSIKSMRKLAKITKINFFRILEINQKLPTIHRTFIKEKQLIKVYEQQIVCSFKLLNISRCAETWKAGSSTVTVAMKKQPSIYEDRTEPSSPKYPISRELTKWKLPGESSLECFFFFDLNQSSHGVKPCLYEFVKSNQG